MRPTTLRHVVGGARSLRCSTSGNGLIWCSRARCTLRSVRTERPMPSETDTSAQERRELPDSVVRAQLERILASEVFSRSQQLRRFLSFIVEQRLAGQGQSLKESVLAHELYGKGTDFDGGTNPVVRVDARRLRDKLREYLRGPIRSRRHLAAEGQLRAGLRTEFRLAYPHRSSSCCSGGAADGAGCQSRRRFPTSRGQGSPSALWCSSLWSSPPRLHGAHSPGRRPLQPSYSRWLRTQVSKGRRRCRPTATSSPSPGRGGPIWGPSTSPIRAPPTSM